jgi:hypothetical protein
MLLPSSDPELNEDVVSLYSQVTRKVIKTAVGRKEMEPYGYR